MKDTKIKNFTQELETIEQFENYKNQKVIIENCDGEAFITKSKRNFKLSFDGIFCYKSDKKIKVHINSTEFIFKSIDFKEPINEVFANVPCQHTFDIDTVFKGSLDEVCLFRMFFFDNSKTTNIFHTKLGSVNSEGNNTDARASIRLTVNSHIYNISQHKNNSKSYFVIENLEPTSLKEFEEDSYAIQKGVGFLIGFMPGGENYIFSGENFVYRRLSRKSLKSIFYPVTSNPYSKLHKQREIADSYYGKLKVIPTDVISDFVSQLRNNEDFSVAIIFLMEVTSLKSVVSMPGVFSVILESLANIIVIKQNKLEKLVTDKQLVEDIITDLNAVIDLHASKINPDAEIKIRRRISDLNKPINHNRLTNAEKLRAPFDQLNIKLSQEDEKAIDYRNDLLHGNILMNDEIKRTSEEIDSQMLYVSAKLYTLISKLVLKNSGYNGYVINHAKFYKQSPITSKDEYFEVI
ncbi:hypothetical protein ACNQGL_08780 [Flavobacterium sp. LB3P21]|uniref:hypothetical protein n=1 Tax=Flavobacterium sp. LB3P21 TaxID=3401719 RepID=UPI003AB036FC